MDCKDYVAIFKALGEDTRLEIFQMLRDGSLCACKIQEKFNLTQPTLSHHLKVLSDCGLVNGTKDGKWIFYSINCDTLSQIISFVSDTKCRREDNECNGNDNKSNGEKCKCD